MGNNRIYKNNPSRRRKQRNPADRERDTKRRLRSQAREHFDSTYEDPDAHETEVARPLDYRFQLFQYVTNQVDFGEHRPEDLSSSIRPFIAWGLHHDEHGELVGIDCLPTSTKSRALKILKNLVLPPEINARCGGGLVHAAIMTHKSEFFENAANSGLLVKDNIFPESLLPDMILRRAAALLFDQQKSDITVPNYDIMRHRTGIVFNTIKTHDVRQPGVFVPEAVDAPYEQNPFTIPHLLEQDDIDRICLIARHYGQYCYDRDLPFVCPPIGKWPDWSDEFMAMAENLPKSKPSWFDDHIEDLETGFSSPEGPA